MTKQQRLSKIAQVQRSWLELIDAARDLNIARDEAKALVGQISGLDEVDWSPEVCEEYLDLAIDSFSQRGI